MSAQHPTLHERIETRTAGDMRLLYGLGVPTLIATGLIVLVIYTPEWWLIPLLMIVLVGMVGVVVTGFGQMLNEDGDEEDKTSAG